MNQNEPVKDKKKLNVVESFKQEWYESKKVALVYLILRILVVAVLILEALREEWYNVFLCILTLILFLLPDFIENRFNIKLPDGLSIIIVVFIFAAEILGEISEFYIHFPYWDTILHTMNGFLAAAIGLAMIDILNQSDKTAINLAPKYVAVASFCFSMTIGVLWEFFEYFMDTFFGMDMQKDTYIHSITSTLLNPDGRIDPYTVQIENVVVNGQQWPAYIDIGLIDTMSDMFVNFIGAAIFAVYGFIYIRGRSKRVNSLVESIIPTVDIEPEEETLIDPEINLDTEDDQ